VNASSMDLSTVVDEIASVVGPGFVRRPSDHGLADADATRSLPGHNFAIDGRQPRLIVLPGNANEVAEVLRIASASGQSVVPWGGGNHQSFGNAPNTYDLALSTERLIAIEDYAPESLTVRLGAGITVDVANAALGARGQFLPVAVARPDRTTIGGLVASGLTGALRQRYGALRDRVIGIEVATPDGRVARFGGKVVKNVAGYDMAKLYVGSFGTFGVITSATFKITPSPIASTAVITRFATLEGAQSLASRFRTAPYTPEAVELFNPGASEWIGFGEYHVVATWLAGTSLVLERTRRETVGWAEASGAEIIDVVTGDQAVAAWLKQIDFGYSPGGARVRVGVPPSSVFAAFQLLASVAPCVRAHASGGILHAFWPTPPEASEFARAIAHLQDAMASIKGYVCVESCAPSAKEILGVDGLWGAPGPELPLMRDLKSRLDPAGVMNPGRFVGGL
jgi:glycolate oxidase FAD binding subunit